MSEETNDAYLLKKIEAAKINIKKTGKILILGWVFLFVFGALTTYLSVAFSLITIGTTVIYRGDVSYWIALVTGFSFLIALSGPFLIVGSIIAGIHYNGQCKDYYRKLTIIPNEQRACSVCPYCKKVLPKDYADICIFCGYNQYKNKITYHYKGQPITSHPT